MILVPTTPNPSQTLTIALAGQPTRLNIYQRSTGLFMDVLLNDVLVIGGVICLNRVKIIRTPYLGYIGDFAWVDTQGQDDPYYTGLGSRWALLYYSPDELAA